MKKFLVLAILALVGISASAQVRYSRTMVEKKTTMWYLRAGAGFNSLGGDVADVEGYDVSGKAGYELALGFNKNIGKAGAYWGMELGFSSRGFEVSETDDEDGDYSYTGHNVKWTPLMFGYKYGLNEDVKLDAHLGAFASYDFATSEDYGSSYSEIDCPEAFNAGIQVGVGVWYKRVNLDLMYQAGLINAIDDYYRGEEATGKMSAFVVRLGFSF